MSTTFILWIAAIGTCAALAMQWVMLRSRYLKGLELQRARHQQQQQLVQQRLEHAKQQIGQLQHALTAARLQVKRQLAAPAQAVPPQSVGNTGPVAHHTLANDGFADTLPSPQFAHDVSLLTH